MAQTATPASPFRIELLGKAHDRATFSSGSEPLDRYLKTQASQDMRRRISSCFVAVDAATGAVAGYYTIAATGIPLDKFPDDIAKKLPRYPLVAAGLLGRLAVATNQQGKGLGAGLLADAIRRIAAADLMAYALVVDAKDDAALRFYQHFGFVLLGGEAARLVLPVATALTLVGGKP